MSSFELLGQTTITSTWLTTIWLISLGISVGFVIILLLLLIGYALSRTPGVNRFFDHQPTRWAVGTVATLAVLAACYPLFQYAYSYFQFDVPAETEGRGSFVELLFFVVPIVFLLVMALLSMTSRLMMNEIHIIFRDGPMFWFSIVSIVMAVFCVTGILLSVVGLSGVSLVIEEPKAVYKSLLEYPRLMTPVHHTYQVKNVLEGEAIDFGFVGSEIGEVAFASKEKMRINDKPFDPVVDQISTYGLTVDGENKLKSYLGNEGVFFSQGVVDKLYVKLERGSESQLDMFVERVPEIPEVRTAYLSAISVIVLFLLYLLQRSAMPKISAISLSTFKTEVAQPLYLLLLIVGSCVLIAFIYIPGNTFGEDIKILKDSGMKIILVFSIFMAVYAASKSLAEEIEGRTALTVLSKPVGRRQFILGKFIGIAWSVALMFIVLGIVLAICVAYKPIYDAAESTREEIPWTLCHLETMRIIPGLLLGYMEVLLFVAISVVISTRLPIMPNLMICFAIYVVGHLTPLMVASTTAVQAFEPVVFIGQLIAVIFPVLDHFDVQAAVSGEADIPLRYLGWSSVYCLIYGTIAMLLALVLFEDRDLA
jgi:ABC-type transport system involved in multi-copper enzyme maturation permease subunit